MPPWLHIRVDLLHGNGMELDPPPGRVIICGPEHTFGELAYAINTAFARWDHGHLHYFELTDGRRIGFPDDWGRGLDLGWEDQDELLPAKELAPGDEFTFTFDLGDDWSHRCRVLQAETYLDALEAPDRPVPILGWGTIPDQYDRLSPGDFELED
ncbi:MAG: hypothetical protein H6533_13035 [Thermoleophilales bacterium]|nr:hypothetical protein [Thermoleophilales bacterium]